jgi:hypothetical protein
MDRPRRKLLHRAGTALAVAAALAGYACGSSGERAALSSRILGESRPLLISLPDGYDDATRSYPVLYVLDAWDSSRLATWRPALRQVAASGIGDLIVVGVVNTDRSRDMLACGPRSSGEAGANAFLRFLGEELIPWVEMRHRTNGRRVLFGRSDSGLFAVYVFVSAPETFTSYIASSPTLGYCPELMLERVEQVLGSGRVANRALFVIYGERDIPLSHESLPSFTALFSKDSPGNLRWAVERVPGVGHLPDDALESGLRFVFQPH